MNRYDLALGRRPPKPVEDVIEQVKERASKKSPAVDSSTSEAQRASLISSYLSNRESRVGLANLMTDNLRQRIEFGSLARRLMNVETLPPDILPIFDTPYDSYYMDSRGDLAVRKPERVQRMVSPTFDITCNTTIPLTHLRDRRSDIIERAQGIAVNDIINSETACLFKLLEAATRSSSCVFVPELTLSSLGEAFNKLESNDVSVNNVLMNARDYAVLRRWGRDILDPNGDIRLLEAGMMATIWGALIHVSRAVPAGVIYIAAQPVSLGMMHEVCRPTCVCTDDPSMMSMGWHAFEQVGMSCYARGVLKIVINNS